MRQAEAVPLPEPSGSSDWRAFYRARDKAHWERLEGLIEEAGLDLAAVLERWPAFVRRRDMVRIFSHYELFRHIQSLPGSIAELGVHHGAGIFTWSHLLETFCPGDRNRRVYGFDHFEGYASYDAEDGAAAGPVEARLGTMASSQTMVEGLIDLHTADGLLPGIERVRLIAGDIETTVPAFAQKAQGVRLSMLYFDIGAHAPTAAGLQHLYPLVVEGGVVAFNGYGMDPWEGEARALERYFDENGWARPIMQRFPFSTQPNAYFIKGQSS